MALVPWLLLVRRLTRPRAAFWWSWLIGLLFFLGSIWWLIHVTLVGWVILCAYLALFFGLFGWSAARVGLQPLCVAAVWVTLEYLRSHLLSGFGWNLLAYSQTPWRPLIQVARDTGAWGVSFAIVLANGLIADAICRPHVRARAWRAAVAIAVPMALWFNWGLGDFWTPRARYVVQVAVVQGNIPQEEKWDEAYQARIQERYASLTAEAAADQPDLIVWPETSVPGYIDSDEALTQWVSSVAARAQRPLLVGAPVPEIEQVRWVLKNSAVLVDGQGTIQVRHDKLHLVPFGEFIPFERFAPWLRNMLPPIGDFTPGREYTVFSTDSALRTPNSALRFSVLVCFEDIFPGLAREFVRRGAQMLVVITNDAWFGPTAAAYQHVQASVFRSVELGVPVVRAANTGWSGCIDPQRGVGESVRDAQGQELFVHGTAQCEISPGAGDTLYVRWGDWFAWVCLLSISIYFIAIGLRKLTPR